MASFEKAWEITKSWEGAWSSRPEGSDEEKYNGVWWGTNGGVTGTFMRDFLGQTWKPTDKAKFQRLTLNQVGELIWKPTRWNWLRGDEIQNQEIANLLFDWGVRRWNSLTIYPKKDKKGKLAGYGSGLADALGVSPFGIFQQITMRKVGGNPPRSTDGFYILTPKAVQLINNYPNQVELFNKLKALRKQIDNPTTASIIQRYDSFSFGGTYPKDIVLANRGGGMSSGRARLYNNISKPIITGFLYEVVNNSPSSDELKYFSAVEKIFSSVASSIADVQNSNVEYREINIDAAQQMTKTPITAPSIILYINGEATLIQGLKTQNELIQSFRYVLQPYETGGNGSEGGSGYGFDFGLRNCNYLDTILEGIGLGKVRQVIFLGAGAFFGYKAANSNNKAGQLLNGVGAAALLYMGLKNPLCTKK